MNIEELRDDIWNYLFQNKSGSTIDEIAALAALDSATVRTAVDHEWFLIDHDQVRIAYSKSANAR